MLVALPIKSVTVVAIQSPAIVIFSLDKEIHGEYENYNSSALRVETPRKQALNLIREVGWVGEVEFITQEGRVTKFVGVEQEADPSFEQDVQNLLDVKREAIVQDINAANHQTRHDWNRAEAAEDKLDATYEEFMLKWSPKT